MLLLPCWVPQLEQVGWGTRLLWPGSHWSSARCCSAWLTIARTMTKTLLRNLPLASLTLLTMASSNNLPAATTIVSHPANLTRCTLTWSLAIEDSFFQFHQLHDVPLKRTTPHHISTVSIIHPHPPYPHLHPHLVLEHQTDPHSDRLSGQRGRKLLYPASSTT